MNRQGFNARRAQVVDERGGLGDVERMNDFAAGVYAFGDPAGVGKRCQRVRFIHHDPAE